MIMTSKRKLTSCVAILCALMILIGIFPINLFSGKKVNAASSEKYQSNYVYFDISNITENRSEWETKNIIFYLSKTDWSATFKLNHIAGTVYGVQMQSDYSYSNMKMLFALSETDELNWDGYIKNSDYRRTNQISVPGSANGKVFSWNGTGTENIDNKKTFVLKYEDAKVGEFIEQQSLAGETINFKDMTGKLAGNITAIFTGDGLADETKNVENNKVTIPNDVNNNNYTTVEFKNGNTSLGKYNLFNASSSGITGVSYNENTCNTFYYGATEKSDGNVLSYWGENLFVNNSIANKNLYFKKSTFSSQPTVKINGETLSGTSDTVNTTAVWKYTIPSESSATQQTIITVEYGGNVYHFFWDSLGDDSVVIADGFAKISERLSRLTVYFDATLSKLSYKGTGDAKNDGKGMPYSDSDKIYYYATKADKTGAIKGEMIKCAEYSNGTNTWKDVWSVSLPDEYTRVRFTAWANPSNEDAAENGDGTDMYDIPTNLEKPCFYADTSDQIIYSGGNRGGYWDEAYIIRDAESGKGDPVVDIKESSFSNEKSSYGSNEVNYVNSTFYDYYTDYELNGSNRDDYNGESGRQKGASHRNWVNFRQFDQALSDYYKNKDVSVKDAIYTGHFQPTYTGDDGKKWGYPFSDIAGTMNLYGWSSYNTFISNNNSNVNSDGKVKIGQDGYYMYATQGIVNDELKNGVLKTHDNNAASPYFDEDFLNGNNSKNAKLGKVYNNVAFPFTKKNVFGEGVDYWWYDSSSTTLAMQKDTASNNYYLANRSSDSDRSWSRNLTSNGSTDSDDKVSNTYGLFPFNYGYSSAKNNNGSTYNYGYGAKLEFKFRLTSDGKVLNSSGDPVDIKFLFSGDDDVWVYIDGKLALDVGGAHGQVTGMLNFADEADGKKYAYVSRVKKSANNPNESGSTKLASVTYHAGGESGTENKTYDFYQKKEFTLEGDNSAEHTLTMYYMERGMWESNMKVAFNFPDSSELEVEKTVDKSDVNKMFSNLFDENENFEFLIQNRVTHYGSKETGSANETKKTFAEDFNGTLTATSAPNTFKKLASYSGRNNVAYWKALEQDTGHAYVQKRLGELTSDSGSTLDISGTSYLSFKMYFDSNDNPNLNHIYVRLTDNNGKTIAGFLNSSNVKDTVLKSKQWVNVNVNWTKLTKENGFNITKVSKVSFQYSFSIDIYLDDFVFKNEISAIASGFTTAQENIPDYGSAKSGNLENTVNAQYFKKNSSSTSSDSTIGLVNDSGNFYLKDKELVTFYDQFRRGSYILLKENLSDSQKKLYDTKYTVYENGSPVTSMAGGNTVTNNSISSLKNVSGTAVNDGRTEKVDSNSALANYTGTKPNADTMVFRSYSNPDGTNQSTKIKIQFNNKIKVGSLRITKAQMGNTNLTEKYRFYVEFKNVGGSGLEGANSIVSDLIELKVGESKTITGIPVGTEYTIHEVDENSEGAVLKKVTTGSTDVAISQNTINGMATHSVTGTVNDANTEYAYTFSNAKTATIELDITKNWLNVDEADSDKYIPTANAVNFCLLRSSNGSNWDKVPNYEKFTLDANWKKTITKLDKYTDDTESTTWKYSIKELDSNDNPIEENGMTTITAESGNVNYTVTYTTGTNSAITDELIVNNTRIVQDISMPGTGGEGGSPNEFNFVLFGAIAIALAGGLLLLNKKYAFLHKDKSSKEVR